jgi:methionyl-tRNA formyltransferase
MNYAIVTVKEWNISNYKKFFGKKNNFYLIKNKQSLTLSKLKKINPKYIFFPHWSWIIPEEIWSNFDCVVFHMTDLPYGRGGTPLQNLILRGHKKTKISALKVVGEIDGGDIYCKVNLPLHGSAESIYKRASKIVFDNMIPFIVKNQPKPKPQIGRVVKFTRRNFQQSKIDFNMSIKDIYNFIRMLDAPSYPKAFIHTGKYCIEFYDAQIKNDKLETKVKIYAAE